jgi:hypothetical protein
MRLHKNLCTASEPGKFGAFETLGKWERFAIPSLNILSVPSLNITHYTNVKTVTKEQDKKDRKHKKKTLPNFGRAYRMKSETNTR